MLLPCYLGRLHISF